MLNWLKNKLKARFKERSTWAGLITILSVFGVTIRPDIQDNIISIATAVVGIIFTVTADPKAVVTVKNDNTAEVPTMVAVEEANGVTHEPQKISSPELTPEQRQELGLDGGP